MEFPFDDRPADSSLILRVWHSYTEVDTPFTSIADNSWGMVVTKTKGKTVFTIRGPESKPSAAVSPAESEFIGIQFRAGAYMPKFPASRLMDRQDTDFEAGQNGFSLEGSFWEVPDYENAEDFVKRLVREGLLLYDPLIPSVLQGNTVGLTMRSVQRRFLQATGLSLSEIYQIKRARYALRLLKEGRSILDTVETAGYYDQAHLSKHLKRYTGQNPAQVLKNPSGNTLSFLYKTEPF